MPERVTSVHFLRKKVVAGTSNHGFQVMDTETLESQPLLDPTATVWINLGKKTLAVYRVGDEFLLCSNS
jgi:hypothetical protein